MGTITRTIRYFGLIQVPEEAKKARRFNIIFDIVRSSSNLYLNAKYNPPQTFLGYAVFRDDVRVVRAKPIQWENCIIDEFRNDALFLHQSISCSLNAVLQSFVNLETALSLPVISVINPIENYKNLYPDYDSVAVKLLEERMVATLTLTWDDAEKCSVQGSKDPSYQAPPAPPPPIPFPPDEDDKNLPKISPPYEGIDDDGFTYKPEPDDSPQPDPPGRNGVWVVGYGVPNATTSFPIAGNEDNPPVGISFYPTPTCGSGRALRAIFDDGTVGTPKSAQGDPVCAVTADGDRFIGADFIPNPEQ